jgi:hypothetical protein
MAMTSDRSAPYERARALLNKGRADEAFPIYKSLAEGGDSRCQVFVGWMLHQGHGVPQDIERARSWFERAASLGSTEAAFYCGRSAFAQGKYAEGLPWFRRSAAQGYGPALLWLGLAHVRGHGIEVDRSKGIQYLQQAAEAGNFFARRELALMMIRGEFGLLRIFAGLILLPWWLVIGISEVLRGDPFSDRIRG